VVVAVDAGHPNQGFEFHCDNLWRRTRKLDYTWNGSSWIVGTEQLFSCEGWNVIGEHFGLTAVARSRQETPKTVFWVRIFKHRSWRRWGLRAPHDQGFRRKLVGFMNVSWRLGPDFLSP